MNHFHMPRVESCPAKTIRHRVLTLCSLLILCVVPLLSGATAASAQAVAPKTVAHDDHFSVSLGMHTSESSLGRRIAHQDLLDNDDVTSLDPRVAHDRLPSHGTLAIEAGAFVYTPNDRFWALGSDSFSYVLTDGGSTSKATVYLSRPDMIPAIVENFELVDTNGYGQSYDPGGVIEESALAMIQGSEGIQFHAPMAPSHESFVTIPLPTGRFNGPYSNPDCVNSPAECQPDPTQDGDDESLDIGLTRPAPTTGGYSDILAYSDYPIMTITVLRLTGNSGLELELDLTTGDGRPTLSAELWDTTQVPRVLVGATAPLLLGSSSTRARLNWWTKMSTGKAKLMLWVDGQVALATGLDIPIVNLNDLPFTDMDLGILAEGGLPTAMDIAFDTLVYYQPTRNASNIAPKAPTFASNFENDLADWTGTTVNGSELTATAVSPLTGDKSLKVENVNTHQYFIQHLPGSQEHFNTRFRLDLSRVQMADNEVLIPFMTGDHGNPTTGVATAWVRVKKFAGNVHQLSAFARDANDPTFMRRTDTVVIDPSIPYVIELQGQTASNAQSPDGYLRLWVTPEDPAQQGVAPTVSTLTGLVNHDYTFDWLLFGTFNVGPGTSGDVYYDDLVIWGD